MIAIVAAVLSGLAFYTSYALGDCWWLAWLAPVPVLWLAFGQTTRGWIAVAAAFVAFAIGDANALAAYGDSFPPMAIATMIAGPALLFTISVALARGAGRAFGPLAGVLAFAIAWTACDFLVATLERNGAGLSPAYTQIHAPYLIQGASVFGLYVVTFLIGLVAAGIAMSLRTRTVLPVALAAVVFAANAGLGYARIANAPQTTSVRVGLGADDSTLHASFISSRASADLIAEKYIGAAHALAAQGAVLIVFPEKVAYLEPAWRQEIVDKFAAASRETNATIVIGFDEKGKNRLNEALVFTPAASSPQVYLKRRFVPVLEDGYKTGAGNFILPNKTGVAICKDMDYPAMLRADQNAGHATLMAVPAWDFGADRLAHAKPAMMRTVEEGFALARASRDGLVTLVDAYGREIAVKQSSFGGMVTLVGNLPRGPGVTLYQRIGDVFGWLVTALAALLVAALIGRAVLTRFNDRHGRV